jgi:methylmalonyl-CoA/ethylmalonyl-CoA epimerase
VTDAIIQNRVRMASGFSAPEVRTVVGPPAVAIPAPRTIQDLLGELTYHHLGVVVTDLDIARELYSVSLGVSEWETRTISGPAIWRGRPILIEGARVAFGRLGSSLIELVEPGRTPWAARKILDRRGEGIFSICYQVDDVPGTVRRGVGAGCLVEQFSPDAEKPRSVYLDAGSGLLIELIPDGVDWDG